MTDVPLSKLAKAVGKPVLDFTREHARLRNADLKPIDVPSLDPEIEAAIRILAQDADSLVSAALDLVKAKIAAPPSYFATEPVRSWIRTERVQALLKAAAAAEVSGGDGQGLTTEAAAFFATFEGAEGPALGELAFGAAVAFVVRYLTRDVPVATRIVMQKIDRLEDRLVQQGAPLPREAIDGLIEEASERLRRRRFFVECDHKREARALAERLMEGDLVHGSPGIRARALARMARYVALHEDPQGASQWVELAEKLADTEEARLARAFLAARLGETADGLAALRPIDTPARRTAALQMIRRKSKDAGALAWLREAGISWEDLDGDGRHVLLCCQMLSEDWEAAYVSAKKVLPGDLIETPAIGEPAARALLTGVVAPDLKGVVAHSIPFDLAGYPLHDTADAVNDRRSAIALLQGFAEQARAIGCITDAERNVAMTLWLELRDPAAADTAREQLQQALEADDPIALVPLALAFGVPLDREAVDRALSRAEALDPKGTPDLANARISMIMTGPDEARADALTKHRAVLAPWLQPDDLAELQVKALIQAGRGPEAQARLDADAEKLTPLLAEKLQLLIDQGRDGPSVAQLEAIYAATPTTHNLMQLVQAMAEQGFSPRLWELARDLVRATRNVHDAEMLAGLLEHHQRADEVEAFFTEFADLSDRSPNLRAAKAWHDWRQGRLDSAEAALKQLRAERDDANDRTLWVNILLTSGRWSELDAFVEHEWTRRADRSAEELLHIAQIAQERGSDRVLDLLRLATEKSPDNAEILAAAYLAALRADKEDDPEVHQWFERAAALSGSDGPIQKGDIEEVVAGMPDWDRRSSEIWAKLRDASVPVHAAAEVLRRPLLELQLVPMLSNLEEADPRRRFGVPIASGARAGRIEPAPRSLALDVTAALTLAFLDVLEAAVTKFEVTIPHNLLGWLFAERQRLAMHQPSRVRFAHWVSDRLLAREFQVFLPSYQGEGPWIELIGRALAAMLFHAVAAPADGPQRLVVRSAPVQRIGSFRGGAVNMSRFATCMVSCSALLDKLVDLGLVLAGEESYARTYLAHQEERWTEEPAIGDGAELYLDDLSLAYLKGARLLEPMRKAGFAIFVSEREGDEAKALLGAEARAAEVETVIERVRRVFASGIEAGTVKLDRAVIGERFSAHPTSAVLRLAGAVDAIVADDRYLIAHGFASGEAGNSLLVSSCDLLPLLDSEDALGRHHTRLRRAGAALVPVEAAELSAMLGRSRLKDGDLRETAEMRALRESNRVIQQRDWLRLPQEGPWFEQMRLAIANTIRAQWQTSEDDALLRARSNWLLALLDMRDWAPAITTGDGLTASDFGHILPLGTLLMRLGDLDRKQQARMDAWLKEEVIGPIEASEPQSYAFLLSFLRTLILELPDDG